MKTQACLALFRGILLIGIVIGTMMSVRYRPVDIAVAGENPVDLPSTTGIHDLVFETSVGDSVRYSLYLPTKIPRDSTQVLALVLHYGGQASGFYGRPLLVQLVQPALHTLNAIMVAPVCLGGDWSTVQNELAVLELFALIEQGYATDCTRRLITGYSMGGAGTCHIVEQHPDYFSAAVAISGFKPIVAASCKTPIFTLLSRSDSIFNPEQLSSLVERLVAGGCNAKANFINDVDHFNIRAFVPLLTGTIPWLRKIWGED